MKNTRIALMIIVMIFTFNISSAQVRVKIYPKHGVIVTKINKPRTFVHNKLNYYCADGVWYKKRKGNYVVVAPPKGVMITTLPRGYKVIRSNGRKFYKYRGVVYKKQRKHYVVVSV